LISSMDDFVFTEANAVRPNRLTSNIPLHVDLDRAQV
jgi:hypothetical protein